MKKILLLGANGFIGNQLVKKILDETDWEIYGLDIRQDKLVDSLSNKRFHFFEGDITIHLEWLQYHIKKCDIVLPLVAIATPSTYVTQPLKIFELDFEANLPIVRACVKEGKRLVFPSTSEVYGLNPEKEYKEDSTLLVQGPINKERWIYSCAKQMMDRIIYAYGKHGNLKFTLFRPFNWVGPTQDDLNNSSHGVRVLTQFISDVYFGNNLKVVNGGKQRRSFTYISDGIDALLKILIDEDNRTDGEIINLGNPNNDCTIYQLAEKVVANAANYPKYSKSLKIQNVPQEKYYGKNYQDMEKRIPSIEKAQHLLNWTPKVGIDEIVKRTMDYYLT